MTDEETIEKMIKLRLGTMAKTFRELLANSPATNSPSASAWACSSTGSGRIGRTGGSAPAPRRQAPARLRDLL